MGEWVTLPANAEAKTEQDLDSNSHSNTSNSVSNSKTLEPTTMQGRGIVSLAAILSISPATALRDTEQTTTVQMQMQMLLKID